MSTFERAIEIMTSMYLLIDSRLSSQAGSLVRSRIASGDYCRGNSSGNEAALTQRIEVSLTRQICYRGNAPLDELRSKLRAPDGGRQRMPSSRSDDSFVVPLQLQEVGATRHDKLPIEVSIKHI